LRHLVLSDLVSVRRRVHCKDGVRDRCFVG
jgi:hypothetical protein